MALATAGLVQAGKRMLNSSPCSLEFQGLLQIPAHGGFVNTNYMSTLSNSVSTFGLKHWVLSAVGISIQPPPLFTANSQLGSLFNSSSGKKQWEDWFQHSPSCPTTHKLLLLIKHFKIPAAKVPRRRFSAIVIKDFASMLLKTAFPSQ